MFEDELMGVNVRTKAETLNFVIPILHLLQRYEDDKGPLQKLTT